MEPVVPAATEQAVAPRERGPISLRSDELLARAVTSGGERPFRALYDRYHGQLYRYCYSILRNEADAQDALQSTFTRALVALREGRRSAPLRPWLYRIAHNESVSILRLRRPVMPESELEPMALGPSAEESAATRERLELLLADLAQLAERARAALVMRELGGLSHDEIAAALQISVGAAKQAIFEARSALFELAEGRAMACNEVRRRLSDGDRRVLRGRRVRAHLRDCPSCSAFAAALSARQGQLRALVPALPPAAAAAVLSRALHGAAAHGSPGAAGASAASSGSTIAGSGSVSAGASSSTAASAAKMLAVIATPKALLATAVIAGTAAGAGGVLTGSPAHHGTHGLSTHRMSAHGRDAPARAGHTAGPRNSPGSSHPGSSPAQPPRSHDKSGGAGAKTHQSSSGSPPPRAPGQNSHPSQAKAAPGNSANAPSRSAAPPGNSGNAPGNSAVPPGHGGNTPGRSHTSNPPTRTPPGLADHQTPAGRTNSHRSPRALPRKFLQPPGQ